MPASTPTPVGVSPPQTVVVCFPADVPADWVAAALLVGHHLHTSGTPSVRYPVRRRWLTGWVTRWSSRHLVGPVRRTGSVRRAAGGRVSRLDLTAAVTAARTEAVGRWRVWHHVVRGTPVARTWPDLLAAHTTSSGKLSLIEARRRFVAQPRVLAMLAYNAHPVAAYRFDPDDLEALQAGEGTYAAYSWLRAIAGDALITADARLLQPASPSLADQLRYLQQAAAHVHGLTTRQHLVALTIG